MANYDENDLINLMIMSTLLKKGITPIMQRCGIEKG
jgi:hypothetical protein